MLRGIDSGTIDLIYLDPPFNTGKQWHAPIGSDAEGASFNDIWSWDDVSEAAGETLTMSVKRQWLNALHVESPVRSVVETAEATAGEEMGAYLAFMAMRLVEMQRVLKPTGSIYLHCDPTAGHYLKSLMDAIFGRDNFRNEIVWERSKTRGGGRHAAKSFRANSDIILFYSTSDRHVIEVPRVPNPNKKFPHKDERGEYATMQCVANDALHGGNPHYEFHGYPSPPNGWLLTQDKMEALLRDNRLHFTRSGRPYRKVYRSEYDGMQVGSIWTDIPPVTKAEKEYATQKPLALLERIIMASSNPGDLVLDPFCGCATACVAAEKLGRRWIGVDVSKLAVQLCKKRIQKVQNETGVTNFGFQYRDPIRRTDIPIRTDLPAQTDDLPIPLDIGKDEVKERLYDQQDGVCNGCQRYFAPEFADLMDLDHIKATSKGGGHTWSNVQLLCRTCNVRKGNGTMAQLLKRLREDVA